MQNDVVLAFDFGFSKIGVAVGNKVTLSVSPLGQIAARQGEPNWQAVDKLLADWGPSALVVGIPQTLDGKKQYTTKPARAFCKTLGERTGLPVYPVDERLTTVEARSQLFEAGGYRKLKKTSVDSIAACLILEQWLAYGADFQGV